MFESTEDQDAAENAVNELRRRWRDPQRVAREIPVWDDLAAAARAATSDPTFYSRIYYCHGWERLRAGLGSIPWDAILDRHPDIAKQLEQDRVRLAFEWCQNLVAALRSEWQAWDATKPRPDLQAYLKNVDPLFREAYISHLVFEDFQGASAQGEATESEPEEYLELFPDSIEAIENGYFQPLTRGYDPHYLMDARFISDFLHNACEGALRNQTQRIGKYEFKSPLGGGAFGRVFLARDTTLSRDVAVKIPLLGRSDPNPRQLNILDEARKMARIDVSGVVRVYGVAGPSVNDQWDNPLLAWSLREYFSHESAQPPMIEMEYHEGGTLRGKLEESAGNRLSIEEAVDMMIKIASALIVIHGEAIVHRDLKPENILLDKLGHPLIADLGLATELTNLQGGGVPGTLPYIAPEVLAGHPQRAESDVYALGVTLFESLTGRRPFVGTDRDDLARNIQRIDPPNPRVLRPEIDNRLCSLVRQLLTKDPPRRGTAADLKNSLLRWRAEVHGPLGASRFECPEDLGTALGTSQSVHEENLATLRDYLQADEGSVFWIEGEDDPRGEEKLGRAIKQVLAECEAAGGIAYHSGLGKLSENLEWCLEHRNPIPYALSIENAYGPADNEAKRSWRQLKEILGPNSTSLPWIICTGTTLDADHLQEELKDTLPLTRIRLTGPLGKPTGKDKWRCASEHEASNFRFMDVAGIKSLELESHYQAIRVTEDHRWVNAPRTDIQQEIAPVAPARSFDPRDFVELHRKADRAKIRGRRIAMHGPAGSGKSTMLKDLTVHVWRTTPRRVERLPIWINLEEFGRHYDQHGGQLPRYLEDRYREIDIRPDAADIRKKLEEGPAIVLVDGLDELSNDRVISDLRTWLSMYAGSTFIITCRSENLMHHRSLLESLELYELAGLSEEQCTQYILNYPAIGSESFRPNRNRLVQLVENSGAFRDFSANPLLLSVFCAAADDPNPDERPQTRARLYKMAVNSLLNQSVDREQVRDPHVWLKAKRETLQALALSAFRAPGSVSTEFKKSEVLDCFGSLAPAGDTTWAQNLYDDVVERSRLLRRVDRRLDSESLAFYHPAFQDYFAAAAMSAHMDRGEEIPFYGTPMQPNEFIDRAAWLAEWGSVLLFLVGMRENAGELAERLLSPQNSVAGEDDLMCHRLTLAARAIGEFDEATLWQEGDLVDTITQKTFQTWFDFYRNDSLPAVPHLIEALQTVATCGGCIAGKPLHLFLVDHLNKRSFQGRQASAAALQVIGPRIASPELVERLFKEYKYNNKSYLDPILKEVCGSRSSLTTSFEKSKQAYLRALQDQPAVAKHAEDALVSAAARMSTPDVIEGLSELLAESSPQAHGAAARAIAQLRISSKSSPRQLGMLLVYLTSPNPEVRVAVVDGITRSASVAESVGILDYLAAMLWDPNDGVAESIANAIVRVAKGTAPNSVLDVAVTMLESSEYRWQIRGLSVISLLGPQAATREVLDALVDLLDRCESDDVACQVATTATRMLPFSAEHAALVEKLLCLTHSKSPFVTKRLVAFFQASRGNLVPVSVGARAVVASAIAAPNYRGSLEAALQIAESIGQPTEDDPILHSLVQSLNEGKSPTQTALTLGQCIAELSQICPTIQYLLLSEIDAQRVTAAALVEEISSRDQFRPDDMEMIANALLDSVGHPSRAVGIATSRAIGVLARRMPGLIGRLADRLDTSATVDLESLLRSAALAGAASLHDLRIRELVKHLVWSQANPRLKVAVAEAIHYMAGDLRVEDAKEVLLPLLQLRDPRTWMLACRSALALSDDVFRESVFPYAIEQLGRKDGDHRLVLALINRRAELFKEHPELAQTMIELLDSTDSVTTQLAANVVGRLDASFFSLADVQRLAELLESRRTTTVTSVLLAIRSVGAIPGKSDLIRSVVHQVRVGGYRIKVDALATLEKLLTTSIEDAGVWADLAGLLPTLADGKVRRGVADLLGRINDREVLLFRGESNNEVVPRSVPNLVKSQSTQFHTESANEPI